MIEFRNGVRFDFCCASGALGFDGLGWWWERPLVWSGVIRPDAIYRVAKTVTLEPRRGNLRMFAPWRCVRALPGHGTVNSVGLTNMGVDAWCDGPLRRAVDRLVHRNLAASVYVESVYEAGVMGRKLGGWGFPWIELNASCPNVAKSAGVLAAIVEELAHSGTPIVLKLSHDQVRAHLINAVDRHVSAYHAINAVPWRDIYGDRPSPLGRHTGGMVGGISGPAIKGAALLAVRRLRTMTARPIVGGGGVFTLDDVYEFEAAGADAFSLGTVFLHRPWRPRRIVEGYRAAARSEVKP